MTVVNNGNELTNKFPHQIREMDGCRERGERGEGERGRERERGRESFDCDYFTVNRPYIHITFNHTSIK